MSPVLQRPHPKEVRPSAGPSLRRIVQLPPPSGWQYADPRWSTHIADGLISEVTFFATAIGEKIGRRRFIGRAAQAALSVGLGVSYLLWDTERASAIPEICCGPHQFGCGPSELCPDNDHCNSSGGCKVSNPAVAKRCDTNGHWPGFHCPTCSGNFWDECCPDGEKHCVDCCVGACASCGSCMGACNNKKACICRSKIADNCTKPDICP